MIISIGGPSNAGKSLLADKITSCLGDKKTTILCQDDYVFPEKDLPRIKGHINWEDPGTIDILRLKNEIISAGKTYDYVIVEGFLVHAFPELNGLYDRSIFIELEEKVFLQRKQNDLRWGREPGWYIRHIWLCYRKYGQPPESIPALVLKGDESWPMTQILKFIKKI